MHGPGQDILRVYPCLLPSTRSTCYRHTEPQRCPNAMPAWAGARPRGLACAQLTLPGASAQSMLRLPDAQLATSLGMSQNATAAFRVSVRTAAGARFQPVQDDGACRAACNITA